MNRKHNCGWTRVAVIVVGAATSAAALAQTQTDERPPSVDAPLGGPSVKDREVPGATGMFGAGTENKRKLQDRIPPRAMRMAMGPVMGDDAPDETRATPEQREKIQGYMREYQTLVREYVDGHRAELEELRSKIPPEAMNGPAGEIFRRLDGPGNDGGDKRAGRPRPPKDGEPAQGAGKARKAAAEIPVEAREKLRELAAEMPQFEQMYTKVWAELRPEQQTAVDERLQEFRDRQARQREDSYVEKRAKKGGETGGPEQMDTPGPKGRGPARRPRAQSGDEGRSPLVSGDRRERMARLFERMSPEQQEQLLGRIEQRMRDEGGGGMKPPPPKNPPGKAGHALARPGERRPPPQRDGVPVPPMDE